MKITLNHDKLSKSLNYASKAVSQKPNIPILSNVLLEVTKTDLKLSATNLDMGINMWIPGKVDTEGKTTVSAKFIADFVSAMTAEKVDVSLSDSTVTVKTEKSKASFNTIPAEEFPVLPKLADKPMFTISANEFVESMDKIIFACSTDMSTGKIQQSGVLFETGADKSSMLFVGLDGFRLSMRKCSIKNVNGEVGKEEIIVPSKYLQELARIIEDYPEVDEIEVYLSDSKSQIIFKFDDIEYSVRLLEGPYPDYKRILPQDFAYTFQVAKSDLDQAIKIINTFARSTLGNKTLFDFDLENAKIKLKSTVAEVGENETEMNVTSADGSGDLNSAYNLRYLQDVVAHIKGDALIFETKGPLAASVFKDTKDANFLHLVMPLRREN